jgi:hypothetical protein
MVKGLLGSLYGATEVELAASVARGDDSCVTDVSVSLVAPADRRTGSTFD